MQAPAVSTKMSLVDKSAGVSNILRGHFIIYVNCDYPHSIKLTKR